MGSVAGTLFGGYALYKHTIFKVDTGHRAILFNKVYGVKETVYREGWHIKLPWFERPIIYDSRTHPTVIKSMTGSKDL
jgi:prohibitin 2